MKCPSCNKAEVKKGKKNTSQMIKGESVDFLADAYVCPKCKFSFFDSEQADKMAQLTSNEYRKKHNLLTADEIRAYRNQLSFTQQQFADFIPVGVASIKRWEGIGIQDASMDQLIRLKCDPLSRQKAAVQADRRSQPCLENGNRLFSEKKYRELTKIMTPVCKSPLYIYKGLFFSDFYHYKKHDVSITGAVYRAQQHGPVPFLAEDIFEDLLNSNEISKKKDHPHNFDLLGKIDFSVFDDSEVETIKNILNFIKKVGHTKLVEFSHSEDGWTESKRLQIISYAYSKNLKTLK